MTLPSNLVINTREDLDAIVGTEAHAAFMARLSGSMTRKQDFAVRPEGYGQPGYDGEKIEPVWVEIEDLSTIKFFNFDKNEILSIAQRTL